MLPPKMLHNFRIINIYRPPEQGEYARAWLTQMRQGLDAAQRRLWKSLLQFAEATSSNMDIVQYLVKLGGQHPEQLQHEAALNQEDDDADAAGQLQSSGPG